jgi:DNA-binding transcriptional ArsR family regulator
MQQITEIDDPRLVKGLAHPLRIHILRILQNRTASPSELATELDAPLGNVSYHVRFLARVGLIELSGTQPRRGAVEHYYRAIGRVHVTEHAWAQVPAVVRDAVTASTIDSVGRFIGDAAQHGGFHRHNAHVSRRQLHLDDEGFAELAAAVHELNERADAIEKASQARLRAAHETVARDGGHAGPERDAAPAPAGLVMMLFENPSLQG